MDRPDFYAAQKICVFFYSASACLPLFLVPTAAFSIPVLSSVDHRLDLLLADLMEAAIAWLVQTILATLLIDKLDAWIRQVRLADDVEKLKLEVERVEMVIGDVRGTAAGNRLLARYLVRLKELLYDADDVIDELDYYRLQQQVQGEDDPQAVPAAEQVDDPSSSRGVKKRKRKWSKAWENFNVIQEDEDGKPLKAACKHCLTPIKCAAKDGTSGMLNHNKVCQKKQGANDQPPNPSSAGDSTETATPIVIADSSGRKRRREDEEAAHITVPGMYTSWDKAELSNRIQKITSQLQNGSEKVSEVLKLHGSDSASSSNHHLNTPSDQHQRTSSLLSMEVYGRVSEKDNIRNLTLEDKSDGVRVLPIVGIAGVGKTALAQFVYNDPEVESKFDRRIWVWVSRNFDEVRLTREMLDFVSQERHEGISSFAKLQEILKSHVNSKRLLLIFDDVWDDMKDCRWHKLLAPFISSQRNEIVVLITTRNLSVAKRLGTLKPVKLNALENDDFWLLFKSHAFGGGNYEDPRSLSTIGRKIAKNLKGNPLAAVSIGALLREHLTVDHWSNILENEDWKSLGLSEGIMPALMLSYDQLPYHLQQCFSYCSIFPNKHKFIGKDLVYIWISQGFVNSNCLNKRLETGWEYLTDLVNLGFFEQVEQEQEFSPDSQIWYSECGHMHDFARMVSRTECATIDGLQCNKMLPTVHHLSIVTDSAYIKDQYGEFPRNEKFEENMRNTVTSARTLRTLVLLGHYDSFLLQVLQDILQKAHNLRLLQMSAAGADFNSLMCSLVNPTHLRYVKNKFDGFIRPLPLVLIKFFHLQVLDVGSSVNPIVLDGMHKLVSLRHLVAEKGVGSKIASIGSMTSLQELHEFNVHFCSSGFEITQLQSMNELVELGVSQLHSVKTREEAYGAGLRDKVHLAKLHLSWKDALSDEEYSSDSSFESSEEVLTVDDGGQSSEPFGGTAREVLDGLEPRMGLKHLHISWYIGTTSPTWLASNISVTSLQTLHLDGCGGWRILPSLESLPFLTKLKLRNMLKVIEVLVPPLEELVLIKMPKLMRCSSTSVEGLNSCLRVLQIEKCHALTVFDLFENDDEIEIKQRSRLPGLRKLILRYCPGLKVLNQLPPSTTCSELLITRVSILPSMKGSSSEKLSIGYFDDDEEEEEEDEIGVDIFDENSDELGILDDKILAFHNLRNLKSMRIDGCQNLMSISFEGFSQLVSLKNLEIWRCKKLFSPDVMPEHTLEDLTAANWKAFPCLESLSIRLCGIAGTLLSLLLRHAPGLEELLLDELPIEEGDSSSGDSLTGLAQDGLAHIPLNLISSLKRITTWRCARNNLYKWECSHLFSSLVLKDGNDYWANERCLLPTSLEELGIYADHSLETLQPCFPSDLTNLKKLNVWHCRDLESLQLRSCMALEELNIGVCRSLTTIHGLQSLGSLRHLKVDHCPGLPPYLERFSRQGYELCSRLETLEINAPSVFTMSFCKRLTSLRRLRLEELVLTEEQGRALALLNSLQQLEFYSCSRLVDLPAGLHALPCLKRLDIWRCRGISRLPETGLPRSLEELQIDLCRKELADQCRLLATSKLRVKIDGHWLVS
uniref:Uncharacterized protein n=1 Tax=Avena sativa TaxID=4498 RepID=A0ACD5UUQ2_AVESA